MREVTIDTNVYGAFKANDEGVVRAFRIFDRIHVPVPVLAELVAGFRAGSRETDNREELRRFLNTPRVCVDHLDDATAEFYAHVYLVLRMKGRAIPTNDMWIAASDLQHGCALYSLDAHFSEIDGLLLV